MGGRALRLQSCLEGSGQMLLITSDGTDPALINKERNFHKFSGLSFVCSVGC